MVMPLRVMPTLKTTVTAIQFAIQMSYRHGCAVVAIIFRLVRQRQTCRKLEYAALFRAAVSAISFFFSFCLRYF